LDFSQELITTLHNLSINKDKFEKCLIEKYHRTTCFSRTSNVI